MAQVETTGGGFVDSGDRSIERKVVVSSDGTLTRPNSSRGWPLTNVSITKEPGGVLRGVYEFSQGGEGDASYNQYGKRVELTGGTREVPIYNHSDFAALTPQQIQDVQDAVENKTQGPFASAAQTKLFGFLVRGTEYYLAPSIVGRVSRIESNLPSLSRIAKVANPPELDAPSGNFWICTAITATPVGNRYEVTREFTLSPSAWADVQALYT
jgi:hypothetical protein